MQLAFQTLDSTFPRTLPPAAPAQAGAIGRLDALFLLNSLTVGGSERKAVRLVNALAARGMRCGLAYLNGPDTLRSGLDAQVPHWDLERTGRFSPRALLRLKGLIETHRPAVVLGMNLYPALYMTTASLMLGRRSPRTAALINTMCGAGMPLWRRWLYRSVVRRADVSVHGCAAYRATWLPGAAQNARVIYNGVDTAEFDPAALGVNAADCRARFGIPEGRFVIGTVGRLVPGKNHGVLLETARRLVSSGRNVQVLLAGDGPEREALMARAARMELRSRLTITGMLADVRPALQAMDVFVLPSLGVETFSNAALEAMAMARPVILTDVGGAREMLDGAGGCVLSPDELPARLPAVLTQLHADTGRRARLGAAARTRVQTHFSFEGMLDHYAALIEGAAAARGDRP